MIDLTLWNWNTAKVGQLCQTVVALECTLLLQNEEMYGTVTLAGSACEHCLLRQDRTHKNGNN